MQNYGTPRGEGTGNKQVGDWQKQKARKASIADHQSTNVRRHQQKRGTSTLGWKKEHSLSVTPQRGKKISTNREKTKEKDDIRKPLCL